MSEISSRKPKAPKADKKAAKPKAPKADKLNREDLPNPVWFKPVMFGFLLVGLIWIITYYVSGALYPLGAGVPALNLGNWNILIGFGIAMVGFVMTTRWK